MDDTASHHHRTTVPQSTLRDGMVIKLLDCSADVSKLSVALVGILSNALLPAKLAVELHHTDLRSLPFHHTQSLPG